MTEPPFPIDMFAFWRASIAASLAIWNTIFDCLDQADRATASVGPSAESFRNGAGNSAPV